MHHTRKTQTSVALILIADVIYDATVKVLLLGFHKKGTKGPPEQKKPPAPSMKKAAIQSYRINKGKHVSIRMHSKIV